jgi:hypothetical protein
MSIVKMAIGWRRSGVGNIAAGAAALEEAEGASGPGRRLVRLRLPGKLAARAGRQRWVP